MPVKENTETHTPENEPVCQETQNQPPPTEVREITQTDKLNKRLLQSFLTRINQSNYNFNAVDDENEEKGNESDTNNFQ
ncbi:uncharacterized protein LOC114329018 [Diabrotica virgifera virgifera]|uniref:Uncharacterized protein n=1 Tax=Diabrotica virgifera virgifera TaxID=50390 RepID=A0ABM5IIV8_DIAVI|nr:uncharacterized protein LOC114329018 [Diabrotica virgifera virgifera]